MDRPQTDAFRAACVLNECLISFVKTGYSGNNEIERRVREHLREMGYVPTTGFPVAQSEIDDTPNGLLSEVCPGYKQF